MGFKDSVKRYIQYIHVGTLICSLLLSSFCSIKSVRRVYLLTNIDDTSGMRKRPDSEYDKRNISMLTSGTGTTTTLPEHLSHSLF